MTIDPEIREKVYGYFVSEAQDLLQEIERDLLGFKEDHTSAKIHNLLRSVHTLKGGAASVGLETIKNVAHVLEDIFSALRNPDVVIDDEIEALLFQGYECLRSPLMAELTGGQIDEADILNRAASVIAQIQMKLGDLFERETPLPTSAELGFDMVQQIFEVGVTQRLEDLQSVLQQSDSTIIAAALQEKAEVFLGLAESLNLPGFGAIAQATLQALELHPNAALPIAQIAFADFDQGKTIVLAGDRTQGGFPSSALLQFAGVTESLDTSASPFTTEGLGESWLTDAAIEADIADVISSTSEISTEALPQTTGKTRLQITAEALPEVTRTTAVSINNGTTTEISNETTPKTTIETIVEPTTDTIIETIPENTIEIDSTSAIKVESKSQIDWHQLLGNNRISDSESTQNLEGESEQDMMEAQPIIMNSLLLESDTTVELELSLDELFGRYTPAQSPIEEQSTPPLETRNEPSLTTNDTDSINSLKHVREMKAKPREANPTDSRFVSRSISSRINASQGNSNQYSVNNSTNASTNAPTSTSTNISVTTSTNTSINHRTSSLANGLINGSTNSAVNYASNSPTLRGRESIAQTVRVDLPQLERLNHLAGELLISQNQQINQDDQHRSIVQVLLTRLRKFQQTINALRDWSDRNYIQMELSPTKSSSFNPQNILQNFDSLEMDRYSELDFISQSALEDAVQIESLVEAIDQFTKQSKRTLRKQKQLLTHLRDDLTTTRMQPLGELLNRFPRVLHQLSTTYGKPVELVLSGTEVLVDKAVVEKLYDPLLHLIRNAFDHGIENTEDRRSLNKAEKGRIEICAFHQGNRTVIEVRDDGKGIDLQRVAQRAVELNLITAQQRQTLNAAQIFDVLFEPGFSTAAQISDLSGRGVGLDVVRAQLQALRGAVTVQSTPQKGTVFSLQIPLSLTIVKLLVCQADSVAYALPVATIAQVVCPQVGQLEVMKSDRLVFHWQQNQQNFDVPVRQLTDLFRYSSLSSRLLGLHAKPGVIQNSPVLLLRTSMGLYGVQVDQVLGEQELVIRPMESAIPPPNYVYGCCTLSDSRLALALDMDNLLYNASALEQATASSLRGAMAMQTQTMSQADTNITLSSYSSVKELKRLAPTRILLIDDSLTLRQALALTLQKAGYQVAQAGDGSEALNYLRRNPGSTDLIICDIEMPGLNGFEFLSQSRHDPTLNTIPVVMLTSRSSSKYRQVAQELGAAAYMTKPYTDHELLSQLTNVLHQRRSLSNIS